MFAPSPHFFKWHWTFFSPQVSSLRPEEVEKKWRSVSSHLEAATVGNKKRMFLTYSSGASILAHPNTLAWLINPHLYEYLTGYVGQSKRFGIVAMDFPGAKLVQTIIGFNYWDSTAGCQHQYAWNWNQNTSLIDTNPSHTVTQITHTLEISIAVTEKVWACWQIFGIFDLIKLCDRFLS